MYFLIICLIFFRLVLKFRVFNKNLIFLLTLEFFERDIMLAQKVIFGDIIYLSTESNTLIASSPHISPAFSEIDSIQTSFKNAHFRIFPATDDSLSSNVIFAQFC